MYQSDHYVQFYESDEFIVGFVADYIEHGLEAGEVCIVVATADHRAGIRRSLENNDIDLTERTLSGRYFELDARETLDLILVDGMPDRAAFNAHVLSLIEAGGKKGHVRIFGEMVGLLVADNMIEACDALEKIWEDICHEHRITLFCGYPLSSFAHGTGADAMMTVCGSHSRVLPADESYTLLECPSDRRRAIAYLERRSKQLAAELDQLQKSIVAKV